MLEIILVVWLSKKIAATMKDKGRSPAGYVVLFVLLWFGGEIAGAVVGMVITAMHNPRALDLDFNIGVYMFALIGAACGAGIAFLIVHTVPPLEQWPDDDDYEYERRRRRRRRDEWEDGDEDDRYQQDQDGDRRERRRPPDPDDDAFEERRGGRS
jgi:hypothetical protein